MLACLLIAILAGKILGTVWGVAYFFLLFFFWPATGRK